MARRKMTKFRIDEISGVDRPAQQGATMAIMKRDTSEPSDKGLEVEKKAVMTTSMDGHAHLVVSEDFDGERNQGFTTMEIDSMGRMHSHPWVRQEDGTIVIGDVLGHTHGVQTVSKSDDDEEPTGVIPMTTKKTDDVVSAEDLAKAQADLAEANAKLAKSEAIAALTDVEKAHYALITDKAEADAFLAKSAEDRAKIVDAEVAKAADKNAVVFTAADGTEYRKSDDPRLVAMAKSRDEDRAEAAAAREEVRKSDLRKRADDQFSNLAGESDVHVAILDAVEKGIKDETVRKNALEVLTAANAAMKGVFKNTGVQDNTTGTATEELDKLAKAQAEADKSTYEAGYAKVMETDAGKKLYEQSLAH